jgi:hypothetical protein
MTSLIQNEVPEEPIGPPPVEVEVPAEPDPAPEPDTFDRAYVEELRREAAGYRTRAKSYDDAFQGYDDETREAFLEYARLSYAAQSGDPAAVEALQQFMGGDDEPEVEPEPVIDPIEAARAAAREETERVLTEREQRAEQAKAVSAVQEQARDMGYDTTSADYVLLMRFANEPEVLSLDDPMAEAHTRVQAYHQAIVEQHLAAKSAQADGSPTINTAIGAAPGTDPNAYLKDPTLSEAEKFAIARTRAGDRFRS